MVMQRWEQIREAWATGTLTSRVLASIRGRAVYKIQRMRAAARSYSYAPTLSGKLRLYLSGLRYKRRHRLFLADYDRNPAGSFDDLIGRHRFTASPSTGRKRRPA